MKPEEVAWSDAELESVAWEEGGRDVLLRLNVRGAEPPLRRRRVVAFRWAEALTVNLTNPEGKGGYPLTWDAKFASLPDGRHSVLIDFGGNGEIRVTCSDVEVLDESGE